MDKYRSEVTAFKEAVKGKRFFVFDTETTGLKVDDSDVIEFSALKVQGNEDGSFTELESLDIFINPGYPLPQVITSLTGITDDMLVGQANAATAAKIIVAFWGSNPMVAGYNSVSFDQPFVDKLYRAAGLVFTPSMHLDVLKMAREKMPKPHKLVDMATILGIADGLSFHRSIDDAKATFGVMKRIMPMYDKAEEVPALSEFKITGVSRWRKSETLDRIYVNNTMRASVYYNLTDGTWHVGTNLPDEQVIKAVYEYKGVNNINELVTKVCG